MDKIVQYCTIDGIMTKPYVIINLQEKNLQRFMNKVSVEDNHWIYKGSLDKAGYGIFTIGHQRLKAHRVSYTIFNGEIGDEMVIDHLCGVHECVNPDHLEEVTLAENSHREGFRRQSRLDALYL